MRRIEYIAPVESMRGNLSGAQILEYPENNNPAWDTPDDGIKYARNYTTRYIGNKRAATLKNYFSVKSKAGVNLTADARMQQAVFGATNAILAVIMSHIATWVRIRTMAVEAGMSTRKYAQPYISDALRMKSATINIGTSVTGNPVQVKNPWVEGGSGLDVISDPKFNQKLVFKFWRYLSKATTYYTLDGKYGCLPEGVAQGDMTWRNLVDNSFNGVSGFFAKQFNVTFEKIGDDDFILAGGKYVLSSTANHVVVNDDIDIAPDGYYTTTCIAPNA